MRCIPSVIQFVVTIHKQVGDCGIIVPKQARDCGIFGCGIFQHTFLPTWWRRSVGCALQRIEFDGGGFVASGGCAPQHHPLLESLLLL